MLLRARIAERRDAGSQAATLVTESLKELPGHQGYLDFAVKVGTDAVAGCRRQSLRYNLTVG